MDILIIILPLFLAWSVDMILGDPVWLYHPVIIFGKWISFCDKRFNKGLHRILKGGLVAIILIIVTYLIALALIRLTEDILWLNLFLKMILIFYCLAGTTLTREVKSVFHAVDRSLEEGRMQVAGIVGRDTTSLSQKEIRTAALETLAENLSDGVVAPLFWYAILGVPGMLAYKMVNTLDSMIGYKNEKYLKFGKVAARIDDIANFLPARLTSFLMILTTGKIKVFGFVRKFGKRHASPNSGYPEAALAGILDCRFGGTHDYFGESVYKPYIGITDRDFTEDDLKEAVKINRMVEIAGVLLAAFVRCLILL